MKIGWNFNSPITATARTGELVPPCILSGRGCTVGGDDLPVGYTLPLLVAGVDRHLNKR